MLAQKVYQSVADTQGAAEDGEAVRFTRHLVSLTATKIADGLIDPKLVLSWIMSAIGAPGYLIGALVPVREAGALLPQLVLARAIQRRAVRKYFWVVGSIMQGIAALGIAAAAVFLDGAQAGWAIVGCLAVLSVARSSCSASYKDILARTVRTGARGTVSGTAGTVSATIVFGFAILLSISVIPREPFAIAVAIAVAGVLWIIGGLVFAGLDEPEDDEAGRQSRSLTALLDPLRDDAELRRYVLVRALLISTALAPPFLVMLSSAQDGATLGNLGLLLLASSLAAITSSYVWGRFSDRSSRITLVLAGLIAAVTLGVAAFIGLTSGDIAAPWMAPVFVFTAQIAYEGARAGRKTHLADMDAEGGKAIYTALSNTVIGALLLLGGGFGVLADSAGPAVVLAIFAVLSALGSFCALGLSEVQKTPDT